MALIACMYPSRWGLTTESKFLFSSASGAHQANTDWSPTHKLKTDIPVITAIMMLLCVCSSLAAKGIADASVFQNWCNLLADDLTRCCVHQCCIVT